MRSSIVALVLVVAVGAMGSAISCWDYFGGGADPVGTATPVPAARAADVCGVGWEFDEWREVQNYSSLETCGAGGTRQHCTEDGLHEVEWSGVLDPCLSATATASPATATPVATPSAESICGAGWEFGETREIETIYANQGCGAGGTRGRCTREGLFFVEWDGEVPGCLSATATAATNIATAVAVVTATPVATATPVPAPRAADVCGVGWEFDEWREVRNVSSLETCVPSGTRWHCTEDGLVEYEWSVAAEPCLSATATATAVAVVTATPVATPRPADVCGGGWTFYGERKDGDKRYRRDRETGDWVLESYSVWECDENGLSEIETILD